MATANSIRSTPKPSVKVDTAVFDAVTMKLEQIAAQLNCFAVMLGDNDFDGRASDELIALSLFGIADNVDHARNILSHPGGGAA